MMFTLIIFLIMTFLIIMLFVMKNTMTMTYFDEVGVDPVGEGFLLYSFLFIYKKAKMQI